MKKMNYQKFFDKGMSLHSYLKMTELLLSKEQTTGPNQSQIMIDYTRLNLQRSKRWIKKREKGNIQINTIEHRASFSDQKWLVISEPWCGDAAHSLPFIQMIADQLSIPMHVVLRDENDELMNAFLTRGGKAIPKLIVFKGEDQLVFDWGPRPKEAQSWVVRAKEENRDYEQIFSYLQNFYNKDEGKTTVQEIQELLYKKQ